MATTDKNLEKKLLLPYDVRCPKDTSKLQWLAMQTPAVIELSKDLYRQIRPFCTEKSCRKMAAGKYEYQWKHHARSKKPRSYPAQYYLKMMFQWINQQNHIFELENMRHNRLVSHMSEEDATSPVLHKVFRQRITLATMPNTIVSVIIADYLHDPFFHLTGIWAKGFSVFAHVFCQHFGDNELSAEVKTFVESAFERFMRFVKGYRILSNRRLAPLDKRIALIDFKTLNLGSSASTRDSRLERRRTTSSITSPQSTLPRSEGDVAGSPSTSMLLEDGASARTFSSLRLDPNEEQTPLITRSAESTTKPTHLKAQSAAVLPSIHEKKTSSHPTHKSTNFLESDRKDTGEESGDKKDKEKEKEKEKETDKDKDKDKSKSKDKDKDKEKDKEESGGRPRVDSDGPGEDPNISDEERDEGEVDDDRLVQSGGKGKSPGVDSTSGPVDGERPSTPEVLVGS